LNILCEFYNKLLCAPSTALPIGLCHGKKIHSNILDATLIIDFRLVYWVL